MSERQRLLELAGILNESFVNDSNLGKIAKAQGLNTVNLNIPTKFTVTKPFSIWVMGEMKPTNSYYGNSRISQATWTKGKANKGDVVVGSASGIFLYIGGRESRKIIINVGSKDPGSIDPFEKTSYYSKFPEGSLTLLGDE